MVVTWEQAQETFPAEMAQAIAERTCFCLCGCRATDTAPGDIFGTAVPGLCQACKRGKPRDHQRIVSAAMLTVADEVTAERATAVEYLARVGTATSRSIAKLAEKVADGKDLTNVQVQTAVRAKAADVRAAEVAFRRLSAEHVRIGKQTDLTALHIPDTLAEGMYAAAGQKGDIVAVKVERPTTGFLAGYVVVTLTVGDTIVNYGIQKPPRLIRRWIPRTYVGWLPQVVAEVVNNPQQARDLYTQIGEVDGRRDEGAGNAA